MTRYRECEFFKTETTTDTHKTVFGRRVRTIARVWGIRGRIQKNAMAQPFLVSKADCRRYVQSQDICSEGWALGI